MLEDILLRGSARTVEFHKVSLSRPVEPCHRTCRAIIACTAGEILQRNAIAT